MVRVRVQDTHCMVPRQGAEWKHDNATSQSQQHNDSGLGLDLGLRSAFGIYVSLSNPTPNSIGCRSIR